MSDQFTVPEEFEISFRRIMPYLAAPMQKNSQVLESLLLYLKLGGEKMARVAIDALNVTQRLKDAEIKKQLRERELLYGESQDDLDDDEEEEEVGIQLEKKEENEEENGDILDDEAPDE